MKRQPTTMSGKTAAPTNQNNQGEEKEQLMYDVLQTELKKDIVNRNTKDTYLTENR